MNRALGLVLIAAACLLAAAPAYAAPGWVQFGSGPAYTTEDVTDSATASGTSPSIADIVMADDGTAVLTWRNGPGDVYASMRPPGGQWETPQRLDTAAGTTYPRVEFTPNGT